MTRWAAIDGVRRPRIRLAVAALLLGLAALGTVNPAAVLRGWLIAFVFMGGIAIGAVALLLVHRLTGGRWGHAAGPALRSAAAATPWLLAAFVPVLLGAAWIYPWVGDPQAAAPGVAALYLNLPGFALRGLAALAGWWLLAAMLLRGRCGVAMAGIGLVFHAVMVTLTAVDWIISVDPRFSSSAIGAEIGVQQIASALAWAALAAPMGEARARGDVGALLLTATLGTTYIAFMSFLIVWYGNLPPKAAWYLQRMHDGWAWLVLAAVLLGFLLPLAGLMIERLRRDRVALRAIGAAVLLGVLCHDAWLIAPGAGPLALVAALMAVAAIVAAAALLTAMLLFARISGEAAHG
jgi:hypothetical protein